MAKTRVGINGFGRIGRMTARLLMLQEDMELVAINDLADLATMAHLFKYDSVHGRFDGSVRVDEEKELLILNDSPVHYFKAQSPEDIPWKSAGVDIVIEATGNFKSKELAGGHLTAGAGKVIVSAPPDDSNLQTIILGVNDHQLDKSAEIISNASCTTNSAAPMIQVIEELCGIESCYITTVHSYTGDQRLHDAPHKDWRRGRAAAQSIVPTTTGAAKALTNVFPHLATVIGGCGIRVPVPDGSLTDLTCIVKENRSVEEINAAFRKASENGLKGILEYTEDAVVSVDIIGNPHSCVLDAQLTSVIGKMVKVVGWYDNEIGYSNRLVDLIRKFYSS